MSFMKHNIPILGIDRLEQDGMFAQRGTVIPFHIHCHTYFEMLFYTPFPGHITVNGQMISVDRPTVLLLTPSDFHSTHPEATDAPYYKLCFTEEHLAAELIPCHPTVVTDGAALALLAPLFTRACDCREDRPYLSALIRAAAMTIEREGTPLASPSLIPAMRLARDAIHIVSLEFASDLTLSSLASRLSVSPQHLSAVFSDTVGMTFREYLSDRRLRFAASLLVSGEANVTEACFLSGYRNLPHFVRAFRKRFGTSPGKYQGNIFS